ncbi:hypothetical protein JW977_04320 [Candidatus Falkowbacteria bacterium]|nr:hypothetical protein [Candidatus Falkowbacteria bacterium]
MNNGFGAGKEPRETQKSRVSWYDYGARMCDPAIGRWHCVDPLAELFVNKTSYGYVSNNPISRIDTDGRSDFDIYGRQKEDEGGVYINPMDRSGGMNPSGYNDSGYEYNNSGGNQQQGESGGDEEEEKKETEDPQGQSGDKPYFSFGSDKPLILFGKQLIPAYYDDPLNGNRDMANTGYTNWSWNSPDVQASLNVLGAIFTAGSSIEAQSWVKFISYLSITID